MANFVLLTVLRSVANICPRTANQTLARARREADTRGVAALEKNTKMESKVLPRDLPTPTRKCFQLQRQGLKSGCRSS